MEKKKKLDVSNIDLVSFEGFYQTIWDSSFEVSDYEYRNEVVEDEDFTFNEDSYQKAVCEAYTKQWERWLQQYVCKDIKLSFVGVQHPISAMRKIMWHRMTICNALSHHTGEA